MDFNRFKKIIETIQNFDEQRKRIDDFFEKEICSDSFFMISVGNGIQQTLINMLADEFDCWFEYGLSVEPPKGDESDEVLKFLFNLTGDNNDSKISKSKNWWEYEGPLFGKTNDIEYWLYESDPIKKVITIDGKEIDITLLGDFYDYLVTQYLTKNQK